MMQRRDFILGAACVLGAGAAEAFRPRRRLDLLGTAKLEDITPARFGSWQQVHIGEVIQPRTEGTLAAELYSQMLGRVYANDAKQYVMLALAYGDTQSDLLQLHRPETCYPAFGFAISQFSRGNLDIGAAQLPTRSLVAKAPNRLENVTYWTRLGESLPTTNAEQRADKFKIALAGMIPDGMLVRASSFGGELGPSLALNREFLRELLLAVDPKHLPAFIGTRLAGIVERTRAGS